MALQTVGLVARESNGLTNKQERFGILKSRQAGLHAACVSHNLQLDT